MFYEDSDSFSEVYDRIVESLIERAHEHGEVVYVVPGSPVVAERTIELLRSRQEIVVEIVPALSFADVAFAVLGVDPMASQVRMVDATDLDGRLRGPGPILVVQCHSTAVLSELKLSIDVDLLDPAPTAVILHHLGLDDEVVLEVSIDDLDRFERADHLTSVWIPSLRTVGPAAEDLVDLMARLRADCPWDQKQTHGSLTRHLLEEAYESLEALEHLAALDEAADSSIAELDEAYAHVAEELGDLVFQVVFHAHLASEAGQFDLTQVFDGVRTKLISRHPHVFGDWVAETPDEVAANWEDLKKAEKGRSSVTEGIPAALPALLRYVKLSRKAAAVGMATPDLAEATQRLRDLVAQLCVEREGSPDDAESTSTGEPAGQLGALLAATAELARAAGVDPEMALRTRADDLRDRIIAHEATSG